MLGIDNEKNAGVRYKDDPVKPEKKPVDFVVMLDVIEKYADDVIHAEDIKYEY
tara:strand:- start:2411 stop:2569 length:159 start_codon:yes stop_codon:yes gene_type:complete